MGLKQRQKGKAVEREAVNLLKSLGFASARRTAQHCGKSGDAADVVCDELPNLHIEVKGVIGMAVGTKLLTDAMDQASSDSIGRRPIVLWKEHRRGWRLTWRQQFAMVTTDEVGAKLLRWIDGPASLRAVAVPGIASSVASAV